MRRSRKIKYGNSEHDLIIIYAALAALGAFVLLLQLFRLYGYIQRGVFLILFAVFAITFLTLVFVLAIRTVKWYKEAIGLLSKFESIFNTVSPESLPEVQNRQILERLRRDIDFFEGSYKKSVAASIAMKQAEINALRSQINPHFLYNILDSIRGQALCEDMVEIADMTEALANYFRYSISNKDDLVTLESELKNVENYWVIQRYRFEDKISMEIMLEDLKSCTRDISLPNLILQPIVENAVYHGLETKVGTGKVTIRITETPKRLIIIIADDGIGMNEEELSLLKKKLLGQGLPSRNETRRDSGVALINVNERIKLHFGEEYGLQISSAKWIGTEVEITLPVIRPVINASQPLYIGGEQSEDSTASL